MNTLSMDYASSSIRNKSVVILKKLLLMVFLVATDSLDAPHHPTLRYPSPNSEPKKSIR